MVEYITRASWKEGDYEVYIQGLPNELINHILITTESKVINSGGQTTILTGCGEARLNEDNIDYILDFLKKNEDPNLKPECIDKVFQGSFESHDFRETYYNHIMMQGDLVTINNMHYSLHIFKYDLRPILVRAKMEINKIKGNTKNQNAKKILTKEDYELAMRIHAYLINEYGWLIPYLFLKSAKNNETKENEESNKHGGD